MGEDGSLPSFPETRLSRCNLQPWPLQRLIYLNSQISVKRKGEQESKIWIKAGDSYYFNTSFGVTWAKPTLRWACWRKKRGNNKTRERKFTNASPSPDTALGYLTSPKTREAPYHLHILPLGHGLLLLCSLKGNARIKMAELVAASPLECLWNSHLWRVAAASS